MHVPQGGGWSLLKPEAADGSPGGCKRAVRCGERGCVTRFATTRPTAGHHSCPQPLTQQARGTASKASQSFHAGAPLSRRDRAGRILPRARELESSGARHDSAGKRH
jgi:hypothetical protein